MQKIITKKLKNGIKVEIVIGSTFNYSAICFMFGVGSFHDKVELTGIAHLFEHMIGKRAGKVEKSGIEFSAFTYPEYTLFLHKQENNKILVSLDLMVEVLHNSNFTSEDLENEKRVVLQEMEQTRTTEAFIMWQEIQKNLLGIDRTAYGTVDTMNNITLDVFNKFYLRYKNLANTKVLVAVSDEKEIKKIINKLEVIEGYTQPIVELESSSGDLPKVVGESEVSLKSGENTNLILSFNLGIPSDKEMSTLRIINAVLGHGIDSLLNKKLREEMGLIYWAYSSNYFLGRNNIFTISTNCSKGNLEVVEDNIYKILKKVSLGVESKLIENILGLTKFRVHKDHNPEAAVLDLASKSLVSLEYLSPEEMCASLESITIEDVKNMMIKILQITNKTRILIH